MNRFERYCAVLEHKKPFYFPAIACSVASEILGYPADTGSDSLHFHEEKILAGRIHASVRQRGRLSPD